MRTIHENLVCSIFSAQPDARNITYFLLKYSFLVILYFVLTFKLHFVLIFKLHFVLIFKLHFVLAFKLHFVLTFKLHFVLILKLHFVRTFKLHFVLIFKLHFVLTFKLHFVLTFKLHFVLTFKLHFVLILKLHIVLIFKLHFVILSKELKTYYKFEFSNPNILENWSSWILIFQTMNLISVVWNIKRLRHQPLIKNLSLNRVLIFFKINSLRSNISIDIWKNRIFYFL